MKDFFKVIYPCYSLGLISCFLLVSKLDFNPVLASCVSVLPIALISKRKLERAMVIFYSGTFAGMTSIRIFFSWEIVLASCFLGALIYLFLEKRFMGLGGKLGFISFLNISLVTLGRYLWQYVSF